MLQINPGHFNASRLATATQWRPSYRSQQGRAGQKSRAPLELGRSQLDQVRREEEKKSCSHVSINHLVCKTFHFPRRSTCISRFGGQPGSLMDGLEKARAPPQACRTQWGQLSADCLRSLACICAGQNLPAPPACHPRELNRLEQQAGKDLPLVAAPATS